MSGFAATLGMMISCLSLLTWLSKGFRGKGKIKGLKLTQVEDWALFDSGGDFGFRVLGVQCFEFRLRATNMRFRDT